jgi:hypothetical protein
VGGRWSAPVSPLRPDIHRRKVVSGIYFVAVATPTDRDRRKVGEVKEDSQ